MFAQSTQPQSLDNGLSTSVVSAHAPVADGATTRLDYSFLTADAILDAVDLPREVVEVPEWGGKVLVQGLSGRERDHFEESMFLTHGKGKNQKREIVMDNIRAKLVAACVINVDGSRMFRDNQIQALGNKSAAALNRVFVVAQRLSGLVEGDIEEIVGNSTGDQNDSSGSA